jgi:hypothetical protein
VLTPEPFAIPRRSAPRRPRSWRTKLPTALRQDATAQLHSLGSGPPAMARNAGCDVLVSLHLNDFDDDGAKGQISRSNQRTAFF